MKILSFILSATNRPNGLTRKLQLIIKSEANRPQSLLISIPTFVGTKDFSDNIASDKCSFWVKSLEEDF